MSRQAGALVYNNECTYRPSPSYKVTTNAKNIASIMEKLSYLICDHFELSVAPSDSVLGLQDDGSVIYGRVSCEEYSNEHTIEYVHKFRCDMGGEVFLRISHKG